MDVVFRKLYSSLYVEMTEEIQFKPKKLQRNKEQRRKKQTKYDAGLVTHDEYLTDF